jgi:uncharacterized protein (DUF488 family)
MLLHTVGHSNRPLEELVALLHENGVTHLMDVRSLPRSRHNPQFNSDSLATSLPAQDIGYTHVPALGGMRKPRRDSINQAWKAASFRGYADYMQTPEFAAAVTALMASARQRPSAIMCAEALPSHCHRMLLADALSVRGVEVRHIMGAGKTEAHALTRFANLEGTRITYPFSLEG